ncbi:MAG: ribonuclease [Parvibaculaceae bacterium]|nr:ribonuclease [Parvibaculaceae bacterium]
MRIFLSVLTVGFLAFAGLIYTGSAGQAAGSTDNVLAVSWQSAFCETHRDKLECLTQTSQRFDATALVLHGLWPQPKGVAYCNVDSKMKARDKAGDWDKLPASILSASSWAVLQKIMPGTQSFLNRHEWIKHGTCSGLSQARYFRTSAKLLALLNRSSVRRLLKSHLGKLVMRKDIVAAFDKDFGPGAGKRVVFKCRKVGARWLLTEMRLHLSGSLGSKLSGKADMGRLLLAAEPVSPGRAECGVMTIDPVGY